MKTREQIKTETENKGINNFTQLEVLLDIRELLQALVDSQKKDNKK